MATIDMGDKPIEQAKEHILKTKYSIVTIHDVSAQYTQKILHIADEPREAFYIIYFAVKYYRPLKFINSFLVFRLNRIISWSIYDLACGSSESRTMTGTIERFFQTIPSHNTSKMGTKSLNRYVVHLYCHDKLPPSPRLVRYHPRAIVYPHF